MPRIVLILGAPTGIWLLATLLAFPSAVFALGGLTTFSTLSAFIALSYMGGWIAFAFLCRSARGRFWRLPLGTFAFAIVIVILSPPARAFIADDPELYACLWAGAALALAGWFYAFSYAFRGERAAAA